MLSPPPKFWAVRKLSEDFFVRKFPFKMQNLDVENLFKANFVARNKILSTHNLLC